MSLEPIAREAGDLFERARLFTEMRRAGDDDEVLLASEFGRARFTFGGTVLSVSMCAMGARITGTLVQIRGRDVEEGIWLGKISTT
jgi:hypothetical protein